MPLLQPPQDALAVVDRADIIPSSNSCCRPGGHPLHCAPNRRERARGDECQPAPCDQEVPLRSRSAKHAGTVLSSAASSHCCRVQHMRHQWDQGTCNALQAREALQAWRFARTARRSVQLRSDRSFAQAPCTKAGFAAATCSSELQQMFRDIRLSDLVSSFDIMSEVGSCLMYLLYA